ncbi:MAG TPA: Hsp20/alpha crystallin family protein [Thermomicrobiales bacterium]|nr:Hsp20/alpha crystallin family protein [Thermomicrobiales bacterium]
MSLSRWDPFREMLSLREAMNQLLESSFVRPGGGAQGASQAQGLPLDVHEQGDTYVVTAALPGVKPEDIHIDVLGDTLTIRAETSQDTERNQGGYLLRERRRGAIQRSITLPTALDADNVDADYEHGILTITLPKSPASTPRRIAVRSGQGQSQIGTGGQQVQPGQATAASAGQRPEEQQAWRDPSLEEQTPGMDTRQEQQTEQDARQFYSSRGEHGEATPPSQR